MPTQQKRMDIALVLAALMAGPLLAISMGMWMDGCERGRHEVRQAKVELVRSAGLFELHNKVYTRVGEAAWCQQVKPDFMSAITWETVWSIGSLTPDWRDVVEWVRAHPERARALLRGAGMPGGR
jgi:hypothetical protein